METKLTAARDQVLTAKDIGCLFDQEKLMEAAIERYRAVMRNRDKLIEAWLAETGIPPSEAVIVEQRMKNGDVRVSVRSRHDLEQETNPPVA